ncbi:MAG: family 20 glycosylhydrolase [Bacteroidales bacterium]|nr:family 20 glycosylhydrolase [Lentimicrobiaceae bacterium]MDD5694630.1 family 20 glycosylhydrolase [Bacteroidales bacterium]
MKKFSGLAFGIFFTLCGSFLFLSCHDQECIPESVSVIPQPTLTEPGEGCFQLRSGTRILVCGENPLLMQDAEYLTDFIANVTGYRLQVASYKLQETEGERQDDRVTGKNAILLMLDESVQSLGNEGYDLRVEEKGIRIKALTNTGIFYGIQTLLQLLPAEIFGDQVIADKQWAVPAVHIMDSPRYSWRGMHLDVSRHFFPVEFVKRYIDLIAMHKMNVFHWHLTDDNGWRIEIKKYPLLTDISAWRVDRENQPWNDRTPPAPGEQATYGGYYTQDQIREVVEYARQRHITVLPEIEMPGHSCEVFAAYPQLSCRGERLFVQPGSYWPNNDIYCAGNDSVFTFIEDVLTEVMALFPSPCIHIGGDEADRTQWEKCPKCQKRIQDEGLKDVKELQSYFVKRVEKFLSGNGRKLIGWDEILEGGLAPEATVMSWRGFEGGIAAASQGHHVIMCPTSYCYLDYYQADPDFQPMSIGGFVTLKRVYSFEPTPPELTPEQAGFVLGGQGNVWAEFIQSTEHVTYMALPRMTALSEVLWSSKENRNWDGFNERLQKQFQRFKQLKVNYSRGSFAVNIFTATDSTSGGIQVELSSEQFKPEIRYTLDGSLPSKNSSLYTTPITLDSSAQVRAVVFEGDSMRERPTEKKIIIHKATGKQVRYETTWNNRYPGMASITLADGIRGSERFGDGYWQGFYGDNLEVMIDLGRLDTVQTVSTGFLQHTWSWIFLPVSVQVDVSSDNQSWKRFTVHNPVSPEDEGVIIRDFSVDTGKIPARYIKIIAENRGVCPPGHPGAGEKAWIFADEIIIN